MAFAYLIDAEIPKNARTAALKVVA